MPKTGVFNPEGYCPICGSSFAKDHGDHRCKESVIRAIDAANTRAENEAIALTCVEPFYRGYAQRLYEGFEMLDDVGDRDHRDDAPNRNPKYNED